jgi:glucose-1-phosphate cytidylyltransferase
LNKKFKENTSQIKSAVILCGGKGSRLGLIGKRIPKTLMNIQNKPILWYILNELIKNKINHFILPIGHKGDLIKKFIKKFKANTKKELFFDIIETGINTTISNRIFKVSHKIVSNNFLILNGDAIFNFNLKNIIKNHIKLRSQLSLMTCKVISNFGVVIIKKGKPVSFKRDIEYDTLSVNNNKQKGVIFTGMALINKKILDKANYKSYSNFETNFYPKILKNNKSSYSQISGFWYAMDNPKEINVANKFDKKNKVSKYIFQLKKKFFND